MPILFQLVLTVFLILFFIAFAFIVPAAILYGIQRLVMRVRGEKGEG